MSDQTYLCVLLIKKNPSSLSAFTLITSLLEASNLYTVLEQNKLLCNTHFTMQFTELR